MVKVYTHKPNSKERNSRYLITAVFLGIAGISVVQAVVGWIL